MTSLQTPPPNRLPSLAVWLLGLSQNGGIVETVLGGGLWRPFLANFLGTPGLQDHSPLPLA